MCVAVVISLIAIRNICNLFTLIEYLLQNACANSPLFARKMCVCVFEVRFPSTGTFPITILSRALPVLHAAELARKYYGAAYYL